MFAALSAGWSVFVASRELLHPSPAPFRRVEYGVGGHPFWVVRRSRIKKSSRLHMPTHTWGQ
jgi:hypothetical protein